MAPKQTLSTIAATAFLTWIVVMIYLDPGHGPIDRAGHTASQAVYAAHGCLVKGTVIAGCPDDVQQQARDADRRARSAFKQLTPEMIRHAAEAAAGPLPPRKPLGCFWSDPAKRPADCD